MGVKDSDWRLNLFYFKQVEEYIWRIWFIYKRANIPSYILEFNRSRPVRCERISDWLRIYPIFPEIDDEDLTLEKEYGEIMNWFNRMNEEDIHNQRTAIFLKTIRFVRDSDWDVVIKANLGSCLLCS